MIDGRSEQIGMLGVVGVLVIGAYAYLAHWGPFGLAGTAKEWDSYYNLLVDGFRVGQLSLKKDVPGGLAQLADPYDPGAHSSYSHEVGDLSYYNGKLYLYFGVTPAVVLFWPYVVLTGHYVTQKDAVVIFCLVGFLVSAGLLWALWRRYFAEVNAAAVAAGTLALGLATLVPLMLSRCGVWEVPMSCGYALTMVAMAAMWKALHESGNRWRWLAAASAAYGLAVGARPSLVFGAVILLVPVVQAWRERCGRAEVGEGLATPEAFGARPSEGERGGSGEVAARPRPGSRDKKRGLPKAGVAAAVVPIALIGVGLMIYNLLRFGSPFEFGAHYQLSLDRQFGRQFFSPRYLWFNFRVCFLEPAGWSGRFPFVRDITVAALPAGHGRVEQPFGVLTNIPLVWLALAVPLAWRGRTAEARSMLGGFVAAVGTFLGICALTLCLFFAVCVRYEVEFLPVLVLLAVVGMLSVERALAPTSESGQASTSESWQAPTSVSGQAGPPVWRRAVWGGWSLLLGFSVAFNLLAGTRQSAEAQYDLATVLRRQGKAEDAVRQYERALRLNPDHADAHSDLGAALMGRGRTQEAIGQYEQALRIRPDSAVAQNNFGLALVRLGRAQEAIEHYEQAVRFKPDYAEAHYNLGGALERTGKLKEAIGHYEQAVQIKPDYAKAYDNLGAALIQLGRVSEAMSRWEQALRIDPDLADAHYNLGGALEQTGKLQEAIELYERAVQIKPDFAEAYINLGGALIRLGRVSEAMSRWEQALRISPNLADAHYNLGAALEQAGRRQEAIQHYEQALHIRPDFAEARTALARLESGQ
jgi:tetratricopeptide (TPR) repeat protein